jgi:hypothetical protein
MKDFKTKLQLGRSVKTIGCIKKIIRCLKERRILLVFDAKDILKQGMLKFASFLDELLRKTRHVKVIAIHRYDDNDDELSTRRMPCVEANIDVGYLDVDATVKLFGRMCPHVASRLCPGIASPNDLLELLLPPNRNMLFSQRIANIFEMLGEGNPDKIHRLAKQMTPNVYRKLIAIGGRNEVKLHFESRAAIMKREEEISQEIADAVADRDFERAHELQGVYDELEALKKRFPDLNTLKQESDSISYDIEKAIIDKDWIRASPG